MHDQSNEPPEHRHSEIERMVAERYRLLHEVMVTGFADLVSELRDGFARIHQRLDRIEAHLRQPGQDGPNDD